MYLLPDFPGSAQRLLMSADVTQCILPECIAVRCPYRPKISYLLLASLITKADECSLEDVQYLPTSDHQIRFSFIYIEAETGMSLKLRFVWYLRNRSALTVKLLVCT